MQQNPMRPGSDALCNRESTGRRSLDVDLRHHHQATDDDQLEFRKRKRLRQGTHSCWECKRRKERCTRDTWDTTLCHGCRRRGTACVSQEIREQDAFAASTSNLNFRRLDDRVRMVEDAIERLSSQSALSSSQTAPLAVSRANLGSESASSNSNNDSQELSHTLLAALPCRTDLQALSNASNRRPALLNTHLTRSYGTLHRQGFKAGDGAIGPTPQAQAHPVLVARFMLQLAILVQDMHTDTHPELKGLSESSEQILQRSANTAIKFVSTQDDLVGSMEALECVVLESVYWCNSGNLKRAWASNRRAIGYAQLMGLNSTKSGEQQSQPPKVLDPRAPSAEPQHLWFRIVSFDLLLGRILGFSPGLCDRDLLNSLELESDTVLGRIERVHFRVLAQIVMRGRIEAENMVDALDQQLRVAAMSSDSNWWLPPDFASIDGKDSSKLSWEIRRLMVQMMHFDLLNQIHIFGLIHTSEQQDKNNSSRMTCTYASREILTRYLMIRNSRQVKSNCCLADFLGLMAAVTLSLAHLTGFTPSPQQPIAQNRVLLHQAPKDFAMGQQTLKAIRETCPLIEDSLVSTCLSVLQQLLAIYDDRQGEDTSSPVGDPVNHDSRAYVKVDFSDATVESGTDAFFIPYFGNIKIVRNNNHSITEPTDLQEIGSHSICTVRAQGSSILSNRLMDPLDPLLPGLASNVGGSWDLQGFNEKFLDSLLGDAYTV